MQLAEMPGEILVKPLPNSTKTKEHSKRIVQYVLFSVNVERTFWTRSGIVSRYPLKTFPTLSRSLAYWLDICSDFLILHVFIRQKKKPNAGWTLSFVVDPTGLGHQFLFFQKSPVDPDSLTAIRRIKSKRLI